MAVTAIWNVKNRLDNVIRYVAKPSKYNANDMWILESTFKLKDDVEYGPFEEMQRSVQQK